MNSHYFVIQKTEYLTSYHTIKCIELGFEVKLRAQAVELQHHLNKEESDEHNLCDI